MRPQAQASGRKALVDVLAFGVVFHDEPRQTMSRKQGWLLGSSALGEGYTEYENKVWNEIRTHKKLDMSPDELTKRVPCLKELDAATLKELWVQYKRHCEYERAAKGLVDEVIAQRDHVHAQLKVLEGHMKQQQEKHAEHCTQLQQRVQERDNQLQNFREQAGSQASKQAQGKAALQGELQDSIELARSQQEKIQALEAAAVEQAKVVAELQGKLKEASELIVTERKVAEKMEESLDAENQGLVEKLSAERHRLQVATQQLQEEKEELQEDLDKEREHREAKVTNANKIYEENAVLEKQLQLKIAKVESLTELNQALQEKVVQFSHKAAAASEKLERGQPHQPRHEGVSGLTAQERAMLHKLTNASDGLLRERLAMAGDENGKPPSKPSGESVTWARNLFGLP